MVWKEIWVQYPQGKEKILIQVGKLIALLVYVEKINWGLIKIIEEIDSQVQVLQEEIGVVKISETDLLVQERVLEIEPIVHPSPKSLEEREALEREALVWIILWQALIIKTDWRI